MGVNLSITIRDIHGIGTYMEKKSEDIYRNGTYKELRYIQRDNIYRKGIYIK